MNRRDKRPVKDVIASLFEACDAAAEIVAYGKDTWDSERRNRLAGEAIVGRIGESAAKLPSHVRNAIPLPWDDIIGTRIIVAHAYHRIDYDELWRTLTRDVPELARALSDWDHDSARRKPIEERTDEG